MMVDKSCGGMYTMSGNRLPSCCPAPAQRRTLCMDSVGLESVATTLRSGVAFWIIPLLTGAGKGSASFGFAPAHLAASYPTST